MGLPGRDRGQRDGQHTYLLQKNMCGVELKAKKILMMALEASEARVPLRRQFQQFF